MSRSIITTVAAVLMAASFGAATAADLDDGPVIEKPACEEGKCPEFTSGKLTNPVKLNEGMATSSTLFTADSMTAESLDAAPVFTAATACKEGECPEFTSGALKDPGQKVETTLR